MNIKILLISALSLGLVSCKPEPVAKPKPTIFSAPEKVVHTSDGRYAYQDDSGIWWWYMYTTMNQSQNQTYYTGTLASVGSGPTMPAGGSWSKGNPPSEEEMEGAETETVDLEMAAGEPTEAEEAAGPAEATPEGGDAGAGGPAAAAPAEGGQGGDGGGGGGDGGGGD